MGRVEAEKTAVATTVARRVEAPTAREEEARATERVAAVAAARAGGSTAVGKREALPAGATMAGEAAAAVTTVEEAQVE